jgi:hypothetical protein
MCCKCGNYLESNQKFCTVCGCGCGNPAPASSLTASAYPPITPAFTPYTPPAVEKYYFGKNAFVLCLAVIGALAITAGVFAGLYFSVV